MGRSGWRKRGRKCLQKCYVGLLTEVMIILLLLCLLLSNTNYYCIRYAQIVVSNFSRGICAILKGFPYKTSFHDKNILRRTNEVFLFGKWTKRNRQEDTKSCAAGAATTARRTHDRDTASDSQNTTMSWQGQCPCNIATTRECIIHV